MINTYYPVQFSIDYPDRQLNRLTTFFRLFMAIPIFFVLATLTPGVYQWAGSSYAVAVVIGASGLLFLAPLLMILFRQKYPLWWYHWNRELLRFSNRINVYLALMDDRYPSTDDEQAVHLDFPYPDAPRDLNRWLPLIKWFLAIPHYIVLFFLEIGAFVAIVIAWFAILFTGHYPRALFDFVEGVIRWQNRVTCYAYILVTDQYPPFRLRP